MNLDVTQSIDLINIVTQLAALQANQELILTNHLPHIQAEITRLSALTWGLLAVGFANLWAVLRTRKK